MTIQPKNYLVTGCAGFIASRVAAMLLEQGHHVVGVDNMNDYYDVSLKQHRVDQLKCDRFTSHTMDIENEAEVESIFDATKFDAVLNLAARAGVRYSMENPRVYMTTNLLGTLNLLESMRKRNVSKMVLASTSSLYAGQPMPFDESLPVNTPISSYAASKKAAEMLAHSHHHLYEMDISVCRYFTVYGPAGRPDMCIFRFIHWIAQGEPIELFGDGTQSRDFTYVDDIARGTIAALKPVGFDIFNLGGGNDPVSLLEVIAKLEALLGKKAKLTHREFHKADIVTTQANVSKAKTILGWKPSVDLDEGLAACVDWYQKNQPWSANIQLP
ncbi:SDR family NAD(P)-dependent oxidoreductase [Rubripirellula reticaptiva]|uniref:dTDP-glucose 4,6-dehydratase n=1 Tax=Rubripirellula reticaptiva TaxID=2528013 RepID=A0A5C6F2X8_9BACT|nr:SDR family NAD(P)-dependent oxidoreductase [Rubripirellula reticaptiva]TWU55668.1 dTDP-glucose 4,6-dehydratase [Rubripirellula reticaptiva]